MRRHVWCCDEWVIVKSTLPGPRAEDHVGDVTFRLATPADLPRLERLDSYRVWILRQAAEDGRDWIFVACHADRIVAARQYSRTIRGNTAITRVLELRSDQLRVVASKCFPKELDAGTWTGLAR